jgi:hypothetical protein
MIFLAMIIGARISQPCKTAIPDALYGFQNECQWRHE